MPTSANSIISSHVVQEKIRSLSSNGPGLLNQANAFAHPALGIENAIRDPEDRGCEGIVLILFIEYHRTFRESASYLMNQEADLEVG